jgi:hypothetical protein
MVLSLPVAVHHSSLILAVRLLLVILFSTGTPSIVVASPNEQETSSVLLAPPADTIVVAPLDEPRDSRQQDLSSRTPPFRKFIIELSGGVIHPRGDMQRWQGFDGEPLFSNTWGGGVGLGFRVARFAQIDVGMEFNGPVVGGERGSFDPELVAVSSSGWVPRDANALIEEPVSDGGIAMFPFGMRLVLPLSEERMLLGLGAGASVLLHHEANDRELVAPDGTILRGLCAESCERRYGWGAYGLARFEFILGAARRVGVGIAMRYTRAQLGSGAYLPRFAASGTDDHWLQVAATMSLRF